MSETQSYEPDIASTPEMGVGETAVDSDIQALLESSRQQIAELQGEYTQNLGQEELAELEATLSGERAEVIGASQYARQDLAEEFSEDVRALNILERDFSHFTGYEEFIRLLASGYVSDAMEEDFYDVVVNNREKLDEYIDLDLMGEMFPDMEYLEDFLDIGDVENNIERDEVEEVLGFDVASKNESDLLYMDTKVQGLIERSLNARSQGMEELTEVQARIQSRLLEIETQRLTETETAVAETETAVAETETAEIGEININTNIREEENVVSDSQIQKFESTKETLVGLYNTIKNNNISLSPELEELLQSVGSIEEVNESSIQRMEGIRDQVQNFFKADSGRITSLLTQARERGPTVLRETQQFLGALAQDDPELQNMIHEVELEMGLHNIANSEVREAQAMAFFGEDIEVTDIEIDGEIYRLGDMEIDASQEPPRSFLVAPEGNYRLEIELPGIPNSTETLARRREFAQAKLEIREAFTPLSQEYREVQGKLNRLEQLRSVEESALSPEQLQEKRDIEAQETELQERVEAIKSEMRTLLERASDISREFATYLRGLEFDNDAIHAQKERARRTLNFLYEIGFTDIPQVVTDQIIDTLNSNSALAHQFGFNKRIDFANGQIGFDTFGGDSGALDRADMVKFAEFVNRMIGSDVINIDAVRNGTGVAISDRRRFRTILRESGLMDVGAFGKAMENLRSEREQQ